MQPTTVPKRADGMLRTRLPKPPPGPPPALHVGTAPPAKAAKQPALPPPIALAGAASASAGSASGLLPAALAGPTSSPQPKPTSSPQPKPSVKARPVSPPATLPAPPAAPPRVLERVLEPGRGDGAVAARGGPWPPPPPNPFPKWGQPQGPPSRTERRGLRAAMHVRLPAPVRRIPYAMTTGMHCRHCFSNSRGDGCDLRLCGRCCWLSELGPCDSHVLSRLGRRRP